MYNLIIRKEEIKIILQITIAFIWLVANIALIIVANFAFKVIFLLFAFLLLYAIYEAVRFYFYLKHLRYIIRKDEIEVERFVRKELSLYTDIESLSFKVNVHYFNNTSEARTQSFEKNSKGTLTLDQNRKKRILTKIYKLIQKENIK